MLAGIRSALRLLARVAKQTADVSSEALYTLYLFSESNIIGVLLPSLAMAYALVGVSDVGAFLEGFVWLELHLLAFEVTDIEEDKLEKPHRPIPSGRISPSSARALYAGVVAAALLLSARHGITWVTVVFVVAITVYNEGGLARFWYFKSGLASLGYACFISGPAVCFSQDRPLPPQAITSLTQLGLIFFTTGHAQDFRDREGDALIGRRTLALILPQAFARWTLSASILAWATALCYYWAPPALFCVVVYALAGATAVSFLTDHSQEADQRSYDLYNLWLVSCNVLPLFVRWRELSP
ncbi:UbiA prenyltransferase family-domain-containing protein [Schizophyllum commune]